MKKVIKTVLIVLITVVAFLSIVLVFKGISDAQFLSILKKSSLTALILIALSFFFQLAKQSHDAHQ